MKSVTCFAIIAGELFAGVTMLAAYQAWIQPGAPRFQAAQAKAAAAPVIPAPALVTLPPLPAIEVPPQQQTPPAPQQQPVVTVAPAAPPKAAPAVVVVAPKRPAALAVQTKPPVPARQPAVAPAPPRLGLPQQQHQATVVPPAPAPIASPIPRQLAPANDPATILQRGMTALNSHDFAAAVTLLRQARQMQPANADLGYLIGMALEGTGELGAAIDAFRSCKSGPYQQIARSHLKALVKRLGKQ